jgi:serine/threonine protein kinase
MVTNDLGACEWFVWDLRRSGLIDRGQLDQIVGEFLKRNPRAEAPALAEFLVQQGTLTTFQAERILNGKTQGLVLGPYVLLDAIGQGSMGQVYRATSKNDNLQYAVKVLPRRSMWNVRLARRQVRSFGQFSHQAVVPFVDVGTAGGLHYLVWPLVEGTTLEATVQQSGRLTPEHAALIGYQVAQGLNACHENSIFHGLLKPSNIMIGPDGQARILDFGIGSLLVENEGESLVDTMSTANTLTSGLDCASPESIMEPTNRTPSGDQYSLGCVLYYCLTGRVPFPEGSAVEKMMAHQTREPVPIKEFAPDAPDGLVAVVAKLMAKTPEGRFSGTDEVVEALEPFLGELAAVAAGAEAAARGAGRSSHLMPGLGSKSSLGSKHRFGTVSGRSGPSQTPTPVGSRPGIPIPPPAPSPVPIPKPSGSRPQMSVPPGRGSQPVPGRTTFQTPHNVADEMPAAGMDGLPLYDLPPAHSPAALRASAGWVTEAAQESDPPADRRSVLGPVGIVAAAAIMMVLVFLMSKFLTS